MTLEETILGLVKINGDLGNQVKDYLAKYNDVKLELEAAKKKLENQTIFTYHAVEDDDISIAGLSKNADETKAILADGQRLKTVQANKILSTSRILYTGIEGKYILHVVARITGASETNMARIAILREVKDKIYSGTDDKPVFNLCKNVVTGDGFFEISALKDSYTRAILQADTIYDTGNSGCFYVVNFGKNSISIKGISLIIKA